MRGCSYAAVLALALACSVADAAPPKVPGPVKVAPGEVAEIEIEETSGKIGFHNPFDAAHIFVRDAVPRREKTLCLIVQPKSREVYRLTVWTVGEAVGSTVVIDATGKAPPPPVPPDPPEPTDPLVKALTTAFAAETAADKRERLKVLATVMRDAAGYAADPNVTTNDSLTAKVTKRRTEQIGDSLPGVRKAIGEHLNATFPTYVFVLNDEYRKKFAVEYLRLATALEGIP